MAAINQLSFGDGLLSKRKKTSRMLKKLTEIDQLIDWLESVEGSVPGAIIQTYGITSSMMENLTIQTAFISQFLTDKANNTANSTSSRALRCSESKKISTKTKSKNNQGFCKAFLC